MKKIQQVVGFSVLAAFCTIASAQVPVNIVYPIDGGSYPVPSSGAKSALFTSSFSVTCRGGRHDVMWGFDSGMTVGKATFYDEISVQFTHKLPSGDHMFWVKSKGCGKDAVKFMIR